MKSHDKHGPREDIFAGLVPPAPPKEMKNDVIAAAQFSWQNGQRSELWARLWCHRGLRAAWAGFVAVLLFGHVLISSGVPAPEVVTADSRPDVEMASFLRPTRIVASASPNIGRFGPEASDISMLADGGNVS